MDFSSQEIDRVQTDLEKYEAVLALNLVKDAHYEQAILKQRSLKADELVDIISFTQSEPTSSTTTVHVFSGASNEEDWQADADAAID